MTILDLCAYLGLAAVGATCVNMLVGLLIALRYSPVRLWPNRRMNIFGFHNWTAYVVLVLHYLASRSSPFKEFDKVSPD
jgi:hypothetical protein